MIRKHGGFQKKIMLMQQILPVGCGILTLRTLAEAPSAASEDTNATHGELEIKSQHNVPPKTQQCNHGHEGTGASRCSLPELYSSVKDFNKERKQSHHSKICSLSLEEAQKHLMKNVDAMFFTGRPVVRQENSLPVPKQSEAHNVEPMSMADLLHHSLLMGSISPLERLSRSQQRLAKGGIPPPVHIFPYSIMAEVSSPSPLANIKKTTQSTKTLGRLFLPSATPEKSVVGHKAMRYLIADPGKQFMDLVDLEWRYFKGLAKWKRTSPEVPFWDIKYDTEKRFVESQRMPGHIFPPLIRKTLSIYPQVNYKKGGKHFLNWNV